MSSNINYTESQLEAINTIDDDLLLIACAGAGKTGVVAKRIINILKVKSKEGITPDNIVAFTFTEKAAAELKSRIYKYAEAELGSTQGLAHMYIGTIHGYCLKALQENVQKFQKFSVLDEIKSKLFIYNNYKDCGFTDFRIDGHEALNRNNERNHDINLFQTCINILLEADFGKAPLSAAYKNSIEKYKNCFYKNKYFDFSLILNEMICQLETNDDFKRKIQEKVKFLIVDEYQDVNPIQEELINHFYKMGSNICVVGDDDQTIYQFRGSDAKGILDFEKKYSTSKKIILDENFRSTAAITDIAQSVIKNNSERFNKKMDSASKSLKYEEGDTVFCDFSYEKAEYDFIAEKITELHKAGMEYSEIAVLVRHNWFPQAIAASMDLEGIPYIVEGVNNLFNTAETQAAKGIFDYLYYNDYKKERGISENNLKKLWQSIGIKIDNDNLDKALARLTKINPAKSKIYSDLILQKVFHNFLADIDIAEVNSNDAASELEKTTHEIIMYNLGKFSKLLDDFDTMFYENTPLWKIKYLNNYLAKKAPYLYPEGYLSNKYIRPKAVNVMTIHQAKGLEFSAVFVPKLNEEDFPYKRKKAKNVADRSNISKWDVIDKSLIPNSDRYDGSTADERRLFYVAVTRAKKFLFLTRSPSQHRTESLFLTEAKESKYLRELNNNIDYSIVNCPPAESNKAPINLNFSILQDFFECPYRFKLSFFYGFAQPLAPGMGYGTSMHEIVQNLHQKYLDGEKVNRSDLPKLVDESFYLRYANSQVIKNMREKAMEALYAYYDKEEKDFNNIQYAETDIEIDVGDNIKVNGRIDLIKRKDIDGKQQTCIVDFKTQHADISECISSEQLKIYALGYYELCGEKADYLQIYNLDNNEKENNSVTNTLLEDVRGEIRRAADEIRGDNLKRECSKEKCTECYLRHLCLSKKEKQKYGKK